MTRTSPPFTGALALGGVAGPAAFVCSWAVLGATTPGYSAVNDAISRLAATGAGTRPWMTAGFVAFGLGAAGHSLALRSAVGGRSWSLLGLGGVATLALAALPLGSPGIDRLHNAAAALAYGSLAGAALLAAPAYRRAGHPGRARASALAGVLGGTLLVAGAAGSWTGLFQRAGLTVLDVWIVGTALDVLRRR